MQYFRGFRGKNSVDASLREITPQNKGSLGRETINELKKENENLWKKYDIEKMTVEVLEIGV